MRGDVVVFQGGMDGVRRNLGHLIQSIHIGIQNRKLAFVLWVKREETSGGPASSPRRPSLWQTDPMRHDLTLTEGPYTLRPLTEADFGPLMALAAAHADEYAQMGTLPTDLAFYTGGLAAPDQMVFVKEVGGLLAGSTRYLEMRPAHHRLEIGSTWLAPAFMRSGANWAFKRLLLAHAFGEMRTLRVEVKTDVRNVRSQVAIERLGAVKEGVLRQHMRRPDGSQRDTVMYSVTAAEWPQVEARLLAPRS